MDRDGSDGTRIRDFLASVVDLTDVYELEAQKNLAVFCSPEAILRVTAWLVRLTGHVRLAVQDRRWDSLI